MIPYFRAKKLGTKDEYVVGFLQQDACGFYIISYYIPPVGYGSTKIDQSTLAIHFPNMLDYQGNKIFASLQEDGKGGDIVQNYDYGGNKYVLVYNDPTFEFGIQLIREENTDKDCWEYECLKYECLELFEAIGIQQ